MSSDSFLLALTICFLTVRKARVAMVHLVLQPRLLTLARALELRAVSSKVVAVTFLVFPVMLCTIRAESANG